MTRKRTHTGFGTSEEQRAQTTPISLQYGFRDNTRYDGIGNIYVDGGEALFVWDVDANDECGNQLREYVKISARKIKDKVKILASDEDCNLNIKYLSGNMEWVGKSSIISWDGTNNRYFMLDDDDAPNVSRVYLEGVVLKAYYEKIIAGCFKLKGRYIVIFKDGSYESLSKKGKLKQDGSIVGSEDWEITQIICFDEAGKNAVTAKIGDHTKEEYLSKEYQIEADIKVNGDVIVSVSSVIEYDTHVASTLTGTRDSSSNYSSVSLENFGSIITTSSAASGGSSYSIMNAKSLIAVDYASKSINRLFIKISEMNYSDSLSGSSTFTEDNTGEFASYAGGSTSPSGANSSKGQDMILLNDDVLYTGGGGSMSASFNQTIDTYNVAETGHRRDRYIITRDEQSSYNALSIPGADLRYELVFIRDDYYLRTISELNDYELSPFNNPPGVVNSFTKVHSTTHSYTSIVYGYGEEDYKYESETTVSNNIIDPVNKFDFPEQFFGLVDTVLQPADQSIAYGEVVTTSDFSFTDDRDGDGFGTYTSTSTAHQSVEGEVIHAHSKSRNEFSVTANLYKLYALNFRINDTPHIPESAVESIYIKKDTINKSGKITSKVINKNPFQFDNAEFGTIKSVAITS